MLFVDRRVGSADLAPQLQKFRIEVETTTLEYGDVAFQGRGPRERPVIVGIELKKLSDLVSSLREGRLSGHQLPGLVGPESAYDQAWLIIEGYWKIGPGGEVIVKAGPRFWKPLPGHMSAAEMTKKVLTMELCGGLHVRYTNSRADTLHTMVGLYRWWTDKTADHHVSHLQTQQVTSFLPLSPFRTIVQRFPGIGLRASKAVEGHFGGNLRTAVNASIEEWAQIAVVRDKGGVKKLGRKTAEKVVRFVQGE